MNYFYKLRHDGGGSRQYTDLLSLSLAACPDTAKIANKKYLQCIDWAARMRKDSDRFCKCYGGAYAVKFTKNPVQNQSFKQQMMTMALEECDVTAPNERAKARKAAKEELESRGLLQRLFPGFYD